MISTSSPSTEVVDKLRQQARSLDAQDPLKHLRSEFELPPGSTYLCGNSLGPLPTRCRSLMAREFDKWSKQAVEGHFREPNPWVSVNEICIKSMARLVGALPDEISIMNSLTVNIHLLLTSFYQPSGPKRRRVLIENKAFPSDIYAVRSHVASRGLDPDECVVQVDLSDVQAFIERDKGETLCLVFLGGVNYQTGEVIDMKRIAALCNQYKIIVGYDLAHAAGNVPLKLNEWNVDFAAWCTYKYLNSGPGGIACAFVHTRHHVDSTLKRLEGWWGALKTTRFQMSNNFTPDAGASAWQLSNPPVFQTVSLRASLDVFDKVENLEDMFIKSRKLTSFLEHSLNALLSPDSYQILTPAAPSRGCQLSIIFLGSLNISDVHRMISDDLGFICDKREPNILRVAPAPLFNTFNEVLEFAIALRSVLDSARHLARKDDLSKL